MEHWWNQTRTPLTLFRIPKFYACLNGSSFGRSVVQGFLVANAKPASGQLCPCIPKIARDLADRRNLRPNLYRVSGFVSRTERLYMACPGGLEHRTYFCGKCKLGCHKNLVSSFLWNASVKNFILSRYNKWQNWIKQLQLLGVQVI